MTARYLIIRENLDKARANMPETVDKDDPPFTHNLRLSSFETASEAEVLRVINKSPAKSCGLDPILTELVKEHAVSLVPVITRLVNNSLNTGIVPTSLSCSSNTFSEEVLEKILLSRLLNFLEEIGQHTPHQSAYNTARHTVLKLL